MQTSLNLAYGSAMASIGLTIPTIAVASIWLDGPLHLGLEPMQMVLLAISVPVAVLTVVPGRREAAPGRRPPRAAGRLRVPVHQPLNVMKTSSLTALVAILCLLAGCSGEPSSADQSGSDDDPTATASTTSSAEPRADPQPVGGAPEDPEADALDLPATPSAARPGVLARQLEQALATLKAPDATAADLRQAGEFQQLAARLLAHAESASRGPRRRGCRRTPHRSCGRRWPRGGRSTR